MTELLTSTEVAALFGVTATTVKRWADAGLLHCEKTAGNHRRFSRTEVERFRSKNDELGGSAAGSREVDEWVRMLIDKTPLSAVEARLLEAHAQLGSWSEVADSLGAVLAELGHRWSRGELTIIDEHVASERLRRAVGRISEWMPVDPARGRALLATPSGDEHDLGLSLAELCFRERGWHTIWSGRRTPLSELADALPTLAPRMIAVSASSASAEAGPLTSELAALESACQAAAIPLVLGGTGAWPDDPPYAHRLHSFEELAALLDSLPA